MRAVTILLKDSKGNYINVTSTALIDEAKPLFKNLKAQARLCKEKGVKEVVTIDGVDIEIQGIWLFSEPTDKYISTLGHEKAGDERNEQIKQYQESQQQKRKLLEEQKAIENKKENKVDLEAIKIEKEKQKLKELEMEKKSLIEKQDKLPKTKTTKLIN